VDKEEGKVVMAFGMEHAVVIFGGCITLSAGILRFVPSRKGNGLAKVDVEKLHSRISERVAEKSCTDRMKATNDNIETIHRDITEIKGDIKLLLQRK